MSREIIFPISEASFICFFGLFVELILSFGPRWVDLSNIISLWLDLILSKFYV